MLSHLQKNKQDLQRDFLAIRIAFLNCRLSAALRTDVRRNVNDCCYKYWQHAFFPVKPVYF